VKVAYVTTHDPTNVEAYSGRPYFVARAMARAGVDLELIGPLARRFYVRRFMSRLVRAGTGRSHLWERDPAVVRHYARSVLRRLDGCGADAVFSPCAIPIAQLDCDCPIFTWTDTTFAGLEARYPAYRDLTAPSRRHGHALEAEALSRCRLAIFPSEWAARTAIEAYGAPPERVGVVPFGANIEQPPTRDEVEGLVSARQRGICRLLWPAVSWRRKGGDTAVAIASELNRRGMPTELTILGCRPPGRVPECVRVLGFVSKASSEGRALFRETFGRSHFHVLPSRAECFGLAVPEAGAFGVPSLTSNVDGMPSAIRDGVNGWTFPVDAPVSAYCDAIERMMKDSSAYTGFALSSRADYEQRLNWDVAVPRVLELIEARLQSGRCRDAEGG